MRTARRKHPWGRRPGPSPPCSVRWPVPPVSFCTPRFSRAVEPRVLIYLEHSIKDGRVGRAGRPRVITQRLQFVYLDRHGKAVDGGATPYLDCRPATLEEKKLVSALLQDGWLTGAIEDQARAYAVLPELVGQNQSDRASGDGGNCAHSRHHQ
jgi:hypothetical protein